MAVLFVVAIAAFGWMVMSREQARVEHHEPVAAPAAERTEPLQLTSTWTDANGVTHTVHTTKLDSESQAEFETRHNACVAAQMAKYPPVTGD